MRSIVCALCFVAVWLGVAAAETVPLYKGYVFGMSRDDIAKMAGVGECPDTDDATALCRDRETYAGEQWLQMFVFFEGRLVAIKLVAHGQDNHFVAAFDALNDTGDVIVKIKDALGNVFDAFVEMPLAQNGQDYERAQVKFAQNAVSTGAVTYTYYSRDAFVPGGAPGVSNVSDFLAVAPESLMSTELLLVCKPGSEAVTVRFAAPKLAMKLAERELKNL